MESNNVDLKLRLMLNQMAKELAHTGWAPPDISDWDLNKKKQMIKNLLVVRPDLGKITWLSKSHGYM